MFISKINKSLIFKSPEEISNNHCESAYQSISNPGEDLSNLRRKLVDCIKEQQKWDDKSLAGLLSLLWQLIRWLFINKKIEKGVTYYLDNQSLQGSAAQSKTSIQSPEIPHDNHGSQRKEEPNREQLPKIPSTQLEGRKPTIEQSEINSPNATTNIPETHQQRFQDLIEKAHFTQETKQHLLRLIPENKINEIKTQQEKKQSVISFEITLTDEIEWTINIPSDSDSSLASWLVAADGCSIFFATVIKGTIKEGEISFDKNTVIFKNSQGSNQTASKTAIVIKLIKNVLPKTYPVIKLTEQTRNNQSYVNFELWPFFSTKFSPDKISKVLKYLKEKDQPAITT